MERKILEKLDYSHPWVTAKEHILQVYDEAKRLKGHALDIGCFQGHSALAMGLAKMEVSLVDIHIDYLDKVTDLLESHSCIVNTAAMCESAKVLNWIEPVEMIMHDAQHGQSVVPELLLFWEKIKSGGTFIIHDTDQIDLAGFIKALGYPENKTTADERGRCLSIFYKP
jgi:2-polyprenyl-3-methyl-5-hydroxy-6-metoxy-1,4-benzoquinol methylase